MSIWLIPLVLSRGSRLTSITCSRSQIRGFLVRPRMERVNRGPGKISECWTQDVGMGVGPM